MYKTKRYQDFTLANGEDVELEPEYSPADWIEPTIVEAGNYIVFGYLSLDDQCGNPLEDCDAMGVIHHHPRSRYGRRDSDYYDVLGLDSYGEPRIDEDKMQKIWYDKVMALPLVMFYISDRAIRDQVRRAKPGARDYRAVLREALADESAGDYSIEMQCRQAWAYRPEVPRDLATDIAERIEDALDWNYERACDEAWVGGDKDAVLLDLYDHSGCIWSVAGTGMNCRWDTSRGAAVWVPDKYLREELEKIQDPAERYAQAEKYAKQACKTYTAWANGDCYGVVVKVHEKDGTFVEEDACWGYIGSEYAEEWLSEQVKWAVARYEDKAPPKNPNQMEMAL